MNYYNDFDPFAAAWRLGIKSEVLELLFTVSTFALIGGAE